MSIISGEGVSNWYFISTIFNIKKQGKQQNMNELTILCDACCSQYDELFFFTVLCENNILT